MKKIVSLLLCAALLFSLAACGSKPASSAEKTKITVCLDWTPNTNHTGLYVADKMGYYADAGIEIEIVQPPQSGALTMCSAGQAQFAVDAQDTMAASVISEEPLNITAVAALIQHNTSGIISRKGEGIDKPEGLTGKTYSTWNSPIELAILKQIVNENGGDFDKVKLITNNIYDEPGALKNKDTDAVWIFYGWSGINAELSDLDFDYFAFSDIDSVFDYYTPVLTANKDFLASSPDVAKAFLEATKKGYEYSIANPEEAAEILIEGDTTGSLAGSEELVKASQKYLADKYKGDVDRWGYIDQSRWDGFYTWLWDNELIETKPEPGIGFTNDYLPE